MDPKTCSKSKQSFPTQNFKGKRKFERHRYPRNRIIWSLSNNYVLTCSHLRCKGSFSRLQELLPMFMKYVQIWSWVWLVILLWKVKQWDGSLPNFTTLLHVLFNHAIVLLLNSLLISLQCILVSVTVYVQECRACPFQRWYLLEKIECVACCILL